MKSSEKGQVVEWGSAEINGLIASLAVAGPGWRSHCFGLSILDGAEPANLLVSVRWYRKTRPASAAIIANVGISRTRMPAFTAELAFAGSSELAIEARHIAHWPRVIDAVETRKVVSPMTCRQMRPRVDRPILIAYETEGR